jgi:hypothetical protein
MAIKPTRCSLTCHHYPPPLKPRRQPPRARPIGTTRKFRDKDHSPRHLRDRRLLRTTRISLPSWPSLTLVSFELFEMFRRIPRAANTSDSPSKQLHQMPPRAATSLPPSDPPSTEPRCPVKRNIAPTSQSTTPTAAASLPVIAGRPPRCRGSSRYRRGQIGRHPDLPSDLRFCSH